MSPDEERSPLELDPEEMRRLGHRVVDEVVDRWARLGELPAAGLAGRQEMEERLREDLPEEGGPVDPLLDRFWEDVDPFAGRIDHPRFFAFIPSSPTFASLLGEWLASGCNYFAGTWLESAGPSQVELTVLDWLKEALGYPAGADGILTSGGSAANLMGLAVAREEKLGGLPEGGVAYCSDQTHTAVDRALRVLGVPRERLRRLPSDGAWRLPVGAVEEAVAGDRARGLAPFCVVANAGTTNTGAVDPLPELAELCRREDLWLHVDGAYGAFARLGEVGREALEGLELADSLVLDPHKWLYVGYEAGCCLVRHPGALRRAFHVLPDYLQDTDPQSGEVNFADYGIQLTRRARALKLWFSFRAHGREAFAREIDRSQRLAERAGGWIRGCEALELMSEPELGILCFRYRGRPPLGDEEAADACNRAAVERVQRECRFMISSTRLDERYVIRLCPMNYRTREEDVRALLREVVRVGREEHERLADRRGEPAGPGER